MLAVFAATAYAAGSDMADVFAQLGRGRMVERSVSFADLGITEPLVLHAPDSRQELYLPVPAGLPISDATFELAAGYLHSDGGRTSMLMSLDGAPVLARSFTQAAGDAQASVGVDGGARPGGFVRVGLQWSSVINNDVCTDQTAIGNVLRVGPASRLRYRFDPAAINDLRTAWSALPRTPLVTTSAGTLSASAFDAGWRVEALLQREGMTPVTQTWPLAGDTVELADIAVPAALRAIPAFAALGAGGKHRLQDPAQAGALVVLASNTAFAPDVIVADDTLRRNLKTSLDALRKQIADVSAVSAAAFDAWRAQSLAAVERPLAAGEVRLAHLPARAAIVVGDSGGVGVLANGWRAVAAWNRLVVRRTGDSPGMHGDTVSLAALGGEPRTLDVLGRANWDVNFDLGAASGNGRLPASVVLDIAAAPMANANGQTATVYFNNVLIGSQALHTDGKPQRLSARIPRYALAQSNLLRVMFQRQPDSGCQGRAQGYPVAILPSSHLALEKSGMDDNFAGMVARFASDANVMIPAAYLADATVAVPRVARLANATGVAPTRSTLTVVAPGAAVKPNGPFLAVDVALQDESAPAKLAHARMMLTDASGSELADISGMTDVALIQVARSGDIPGVTYRASGAEGPVLPATLKSMHGDVALASQAGLLKVFDTRHGNEAVQADDDARGRLPRLLSWWTWPGLMIALLGALLVAAGWARRRHKERS